MGLLLNMYFMIQYIICAKSMIQIQIKRKKFSMYEFKRCINRNLYCQFIPIIGAYLLSFFENIFKL